MEPHRPDLTRQPPRSPREHLGGVAHLPRMLDKARALAADRLGEYIFPCPMDRKVLAFLELKAEDFYEAAITLGDSEMEGWIEAHAAPREPRERAAFSGDLLLAGPTDEAGRAEFAAQARALGLRPEEVGAWAELIDREEGRWEVEIREEGR